MESYRLKTVLLSEKDVHVLMESLWHTCQRWDIPGDDRDRARSLRERLGQQLRGGDDVPREYVPSAGDHKPGPKPGGEKKPVEAEPCRCGDDAMRMGGDNCAKCGRRLPDYGE